MQISQLLDLHPFWRCVGETNARSHRKDYQYDTQMQKLVHRLGAFTIASNYILLALCYLCCKDRLFFQRKQMLNVNIETRSIFGTQNHPCFSFRRGSDSSTSSLLCIVLSCGQKILSQLIRQFFPSLLLLLASINYVS